MMGDGRPRCGWGEGDPLYAAYHDAEWGVPLRDDRALFELLTLEGAQAGLAWITILRKREGYRRAFLGFDPARVAETRQGDVPALLGQLVAEVEGLDRAVHVERPEVDEDDPHRDLSDPAAR